MLNRPAREPESNPTDDTLATCDRGADIDAEALVRRLSREPELVAGQELAKCTTAPGLRIVSLEVADVADWPEPGPMVRAV